MGKVAGFGEGITTDVENDDIIKTDQTENYEHKISILGIPFFKSTKVHIIDSKQVGK